MIPSTPNILKCPHCGGLSRLSSIMSGNTCGMVQWSDTKRYTPMLPSLSAVQKCPSCEKYFFYERGLIVGNCESYGNSSWGHLSYISLKDALEQLQPTGDNEIKLRIMILHGYNDHYGGCPGTKLPSDAPANERAYFEQNAKRLIELMPENKVFCAELYRELGEFEQSLAILNDIAADGYMAQIVAQIKERALLNDNSVFVLNEKEARDSTRRANEDQPGCVYDAEADKNGRKKSPFSFFDDIDEDEI